MKFGFIIAIVLVFLISQSTSEIDLITCKSCEKLDSIERGVQIQIDEELNPGTIVATLTFSDGNSTDDLKFEMDSLYLSLTSRSMEVDIIVKSRMDAEVLDPILKTELNVIGSQTQIYVLYIFLKNLDDTYPIFENNPSHCSMKENSITETCGPFRVTDSDNDNHIEIDISHVSSGSIQYFEVVKNDTIYEDKKYVTMFEINLIKSLDFESDQIFQLTIQATDRSNHSTVMMINVLVTDVADQPPQFLNLTYIKQIKENMARNESVMTIVARDGDRSIKDSILYSIKSDNRFSKHFKINPTSGLVTINEPIDREDPKIVNLFGSIDFVVVATESQKSPNQTAETVVRLQIIDVNDSPAKFSLAQYQANINENSAKGVVVSMTTDEIQVSDKDTNLNGQYSLTLLQNGTVSEMFEVYPSKGIGSTILVIKVKNGTMLDYEKIKEVKVTLMAKQLSPVVGIPESSSCLVTINIKDMNDNIPKFSKMNYLFYIPENAKMNFSVGQVVATDQDSDDNGKVMYQLYDPYKKFAINKDSGFLYVNVDAASYTSLLDRESQEKFFVTVEARDGGNMNNITSVSIELIDVNDNPPIFSQSSYDVSLTEETTSYNLLQLTVTDRDNSSSFRQTKFMLNGPSTFKNHFYIGMNNGSLSLIQPLDRETIPEGKLRLSIKAVDVNNTDLTSACVINVIVRDINDNKPQLSRATYSATIPQNVSTDKTILNVTATDKDEPNSPNSLIKFQIFEDDSRNFIITSNNLNQAFIKKEPTVRLAVRVYNFTVEAVDRGNPVKTGQRSRVIINVTEINDEFPTFNQSRYSFSIKESENQNTIIGTVFATDPDNNARLQYKIMGKQVKAWNRFGSSIETQFNYTNAVTIDANNGTLILKSKFDYEEVVRLIYLVTVEDLAAQIPASPAKQINSVDVTINIIDVNDNPPVFSGPYKLNIPESFPPKSNSTLGTTELYVSAQDVDSVGKLTYQIMQRETKFSVNPNSGLIYLIAKLDREKLSTFNFTVTCSDEIHESSTVVMVNVLDVNDNQPQFLPTNVTSIKINENIESGSVIAQFKAVDEDAGENGRIRYTLKSSNTSVLSKFKMRSNGDLVVVDSLMPILITVFTLTIEIQDNPIDGTPFRNSKDVTVYVLDVNDNSPKCSKENYYFEIKENVEINHLIGEIPVTDLDHGENARINYNIQLPESVNNSELLTLFNLNGNSNPAKLYTRKSVSGKVGTITLILNVTDNGKPVRSSKCQLIIHIIDINDYAPQFTNPQRTFTIPENQISLITVIKADDKDLGINGEVLYYIEQSSVLQNANDYANFHIDLTSGNITNIIKFDRESKDVYKFKVKAADRGVPRQTSVIELQVNITDVNDNVPYFPDTSRSIQLSINEGPHTMVTIPDSITPGATNHASLNTRTGFLIGNVAKAKDADTGANAEICYVPLQVNQKLALDPYSGNLYGLEFFDREQESTLLYYVKAMHKSNCTQAAQTQNVRPNPSDTSETKIKLTINDINDNPPQFTQTFVMGGVPKNSDKRFSIIIDFKTLTFDKDLVSQGKLEYFIMGEIEISEPLKKQLQAAKITNVLSLNKTTGQLKTTSNVFFQEDHEGYMRLQVEVRDGNFTSPVPINCTVYLVSQDQRLVVVINDYPGNVVNESHKIIDYLNKNIGGDLLINRDALEPHRDLSGNLVNSMTNMFIHAVDTKKSEVVSGPRLLSLLDSKANILTKAHITYRIMEIRLASSTLADNKDSAAVATANMYRLILIIMACLFVLLLFIISVTIVLCRVNYQRKLKAFSTTSTDMSGTLKSNALPGTNMYEVATNPFSRHNIIKGRSISGQYVNMDSNPAGSLKGIEPLSNVKKIGVPVFGSVSVGNGGQVVSSSPLKAPFATSAPSPAVVSPLPPSVNTKPRILPSDMNTDIVSNMETNF